MSAVGWGQIGLSALLIGLLVRPLGGYLARVYAGERTLLQRVLGPIERALYRSAGVDAPAEQSWSEYAVALLVFSIAGTAALYLLLRFQSLLPLNPQDQPALTPDLALDSAVSFVSNTSWQSYGGETTLSHLAQMAGIAVQSFLSAATGLAAAVALIRGFSRRTTGTIGNFWGDLTRSVLYVLLPICVIVALFFVAEGIPQTLAGYAEAQTITGGTQLIARGPVATQEAIKLLSGDGGGFFNVNSAHPFENPTALTNLVEIVLMLALGAALTNTFGRMVGDERQGWALLATMVLLFGLGIAGIYAGESRGNPTLASLGIDQTMGPLQAGGNMEGKEARFGIVGSSLFAESSTASSDGAVDAMHDSFLPLSGAILLGNMMIDEVIIGAPGSGLWGILLFCLVAVFMAGLMIGRTPEYIGKKMEAREVKMAALALLCAPAMILGLAAVVSVVPDGLAGLGNAGPHGFSEILYAYTSAAATNGSAFAGLSTNTPFYNLTLALAMFAGRFLVIVPVLAIAGSLAAKRTIPSSAGTLPTDGLQFVLLLAGTIVIVGGLIFFPALSFGPVVDHFAMLAGTTY
ncbi:MAG TPA: potassium-transporting ATPase subunit KdpA [Stellaceae bacterium]|nr:potassium-transporting ATPase subunit KdpA [Stellaceae bacterium]